MTDKPLRAVILNDYQGAALAAGDWQSLAPGVRVEAVREHLASPQDLGRVAGDATILVAIRERMPLGAAEFAQLPNLKLIVTFGLKNASIDLAAAEDRGIAVCGTRGAGEPTVEMTWALVLSMLRQIPHEAANFFDGGPWQETIGTGLSGKTIGLVGLGRVGSGVARVATAFGMNVLAYTPTLNPHRAHEAGAQPIPDFGRLLEYSDIVSLHLPLNESTRHMIGRAELARMKPEAFLVNTSRGAIVDESALLEALLHRRIAGAAVDVFEIEPLPRNHPFRMLDNFVGTPHLGYVTRENFESYVSDAIGNILAWMSGASIRLISDA